MDASKPTSPSSGQDPPSPPSQPREADMPPLATGAVDEKDIKICWVCREDENDESNGTSPWRSPCTCKLQAHEACLLDWVAELEKPGPATARKQKVECPQCKTPIKVERPHSLFLSARRRFQKAQSLTIIPLCAALVGGGLLTSLYSHGITTVYIIFGNEDARRILFPPDLPVYSNPVHLSLPLVPAALLLYRTSIGNRFLSLIPLTYLISPIPDRSAPLWPPSASMTLAALPFVRWAYNGVYKLLFAKREQGWLRELQPRGGEGNTDGENGQDNQNEGVVGEGNVNIEFGIEVGVVDEDAEEIIGGGAIAEPPAQDEQPPLADEHAIPADQPQNPPGNPDPPAQNAMAAQLAPPPQQNAQQDQNVNGLNAANALPIIINVILEKAVGALVFPAIASGIGHALNALLPPHLVKTMRPDNIQNGGSNSYTGFLQTTFGRSIAGGFLFIVLRDSLGLYSKYSLAVQQRRRTIVDYDGTAVAGP